MTAYTRQSSFTTDDTILASHSISEYNQLVAVFDEETGHKHDGTVQEGPVIGLIGDAGLVTPLNKVQIDTDNNNVGFWVDVASTAVEQVTVQDGAILPVTSNDINLGSASLKFKDARFAGTVYATTVDIDGGNVDGTPVGVASQSTGSFTTLTASTSLALATGATVTAVLDEDTMSSDSSTALATQQSIKAYTDSQMVAANSLEGALAIGNTTGSTDIIVSSGQEITTDTISETTAGSGITLDGVLIKDGLVDGVDVSGIAGGDAVTTDPLSQFAATTSSELSGVISDETGTGVLVFATSPTLITPALGTPSDLVATNATGTASGLTAGNVTTNADLTGHITSTGNAAVLGAFTLAQLNAAISDATAAILGANTFTGTQNLADNTLQRANLLDYGEVTNAIGSTGGGTQSVDLTLGNSVTATVDTSANTFTFDNPTAGDELCGFVLFLTNGGSQTVNWPSSVDWPAATAPTLSASGLDILVFTTVDGGTIWHGQVAATLSS